MKRISFFVIGSLIIIYSCNENSTGINPAGDNIIPLKVGNSWKMEVSFYDSLGNVFYVDTSTSQIMKDTLISGLHLFSYGGDIFYYANREDGLWSYEFHLSGEEVSYLYYKYPCKSGDTYSVTVGRPPAVVTVVSKNETVQVEAGTFSCILYRFDFEEIASHINIYAAPGIGIVKSEHFSRGDISASYKDWEDHLLEYQVN